MMRVCAPEVSRSMADWASSVSVVIASHSDGSLLDTQIEACEQAADKIDSTTRAGRHFDGGQFAVTGVRVTDIPPTRDF
jgi:hypothetical protein